MVHLAALAILAIGWPRSQGQADAPHLTTVSIIPQAAQTAPQAPPKKGLARHPDKRQRPVPASSPPSPLMPVVPQLTSIQIAPETPASVAEGHPDILALTANAYRDALMAHLAAARRPFRYAAAHAEPNTAGTVCFRIDRSGALLGITIVESTGSSTLNRATLAVVRRAAPFPAIPDLLPDEMEITLPVEFILHRSAGNTLP
ncbi:energy transducer TonB [Novosphingobium sp. 9]|uniref:energy transducer TonB family protein n=1 Tax=Novosphingobium sp. 9 TaxID=2025349 RepID=UPI0021B6457C|nr:energy transducer TonB [Novosphingobium sp. 9]